MKDTFALIDILILIIEELTEFRSIGELTAVLSKSERHVYRYLNELRERGFEIERKSPKRGALYKINSIPQDFSDKIKKLSLLSNSNHPA